MKIKIGKNVIPDAEEFLSLMRSGSMKPPDPVDYQFLGPERRDHQKVIFWYGVIHPKAAIFSDMGTGKTGATTDIISYRIDLGNVDKILVVAPTTVLYNWKMEVEKFSNKKATVLYGPLSERLQLLYEAPTPILITNYEILHTLQPDIIKSGINMSVYDESTRIKNPTANMSKAAYLISSRLNYNLILSGQPIANNPLDLWMQFKILNDGVTFDKANYFAFRNKYFREIRLGKFSKWEVKKYSLPELQNKVSNNSIRYLLEDCTSLPGKTYQTNLIEMETQQRKLYSKVVENVLVELGNECGISKGKVINVGLAASKFTKLIQVCSGFMYSKDGNVIRLTNNPKLDALKDLLEPIIGTRKVVIWCKFTESIHIVSEMLNNLGVKHVFFSGSEDAEGKQQSSDLLQTDDSVRAIVGQIRSGIGANFTEATYAIYYENEFAPDPREQSERRIYRIGQNQKVVVIDLIMRNSIEERIKKMLDNKIQLAEFIMNNSVRELLGG